MPGEGQSEVVLGLDTCGAEASLALARLTESGIEPIEEVVLPARTAGALLTSALRDLLAAAGLRPGDLRAVAVVRGPGSFTGMRIGLSAAKALSEAAGVPLVAVSRLAVLAAVSGAKYAALDAGRGNLYVRMEQGQTGVGGSAEAGPSATLRFAQDDMEFGSGLEGGGSANEQSGGDTSERLLTPSEFEGLLPVLRELTVCEMKLHVRYAATRLYAAPNALDALRFAHSRIAAGDWEDTATLDALYLWRTEQMLTLPGTVSGTALGIVSATLPGTAPEIVPGEAR